ncbi:NAD+ synthase [Piscirickettsia litoralis]|uniref:Glutamine-dependent NAD(+) synthetase n=1 Tax=Piscirickettsia litoralis TaxID=1891921 RepID=A0ABX3A3Q0_9GAMM|nr:NAD+ synthase [Piscirickettsia litoralis]ODN43487.1 NAD+ synthase [Piscirickettsia litoralis]
MQTLRIAMAQLSLHVGAIEEKAARVIQIAQDIEDQADAVVFPEMTLTGYPAEDLLLRMDLHERVEAALKSIADASLDLNLDILVGAPVFDHGNIYNALIQIRQGQEVKRYYKRYLPNYSVFDEKRYFEPGQHDCMTEIAGVPVALAICEDVWFDELMAEASAQQAKLMISINASPYHVRKQEQRVHILKERAKQGNMPLLYVHWAGAQDDLVFDGCSFVVDATGRLTQQAAAFREDLAVAELRLGDHGLYTPYAEELPAELSEEAEIYQALTLGLRDYVRKNKFKGVVLGLSGGIDSALTLVIAVDALGAEAVEAVMLPSEFTSQMSLDDAKAQADILGVKYHVLPITESYKALQNALVPALGENRPFGVTDENLQARSRAVLLMAISNATGKMLLTTGNKSEMAVGYATLYGDMCGGYNALKDVPKTRVFKLAYYRNTIAKVIPERVITRPPSAELAPDQKDEDSLPPYEVLDEIIERYVDYDQSATEIIDAGFAKADVQRILRLIGQNEYKRRQSAPGPRISQRAFTRERRYPLTSSFDDYLK